MREVLGESPSAPAAASAYQPTGPAVQLQQSLDALTGWRAGASEQHSLLLLLLLRLRLTMSGIFIVVIISITTVLRIKSMAITSTPAIIRVMIFVAGAEYAKPQTLHREPYSSQIPYPNLFPEALNGPVPKP